MQLLILSGCLLLPFALAAARVAQTATKPGERPDFASIVGAGAEDAIAARRWLHQNAELSLQEFETQRWMRKQLEAIPGIEMVEGHWGTGLVAILQGGRPGRVIAYRADMDALPIEEETGLPFACTRKEALSDGRQVGVMHACGHDIHMAVLLGTARSLSAVRADLPGTVMFILEPGEEVGAGAARMIKAGLLEGKYRPEEIFAIHDHSTVPYGQVSYCPGQCSANVDEFHITVIGRGGHGAYPHRAIDPVVCAAEMVIAFQSIVSREINTARSAVITVGSIHGGSKSNVIPDSVKLRGTVRSIDPDVRVQLENAVIRTAKGIAAAAGAPEPAIEYVYGTPAMHNDPVLVEETLPSIRRVLGDANVARYEPGMGGEDFAEFQKVIPGFMFRLGVGRPDRPHMTTHNPQFDPDERGIPLGIRLVCEILWDRLNRQTR
jgi:amidohydrolase